MRLHRSMLALLLTATTSAVVLGSGVPAHADTGFNWPLRNEATGKCLEPAGRSMAEGAPIVQKACDGGLAQDWAFLTLGGSTYRLLNHLTGLCIDARGAASDGTPVVQWPCATISNETWDTGRPPPETLAFTSRVSGSSSHCLGFSGGAAPDDAAVLLFKCNGAAAQRWLVGVGTVVQQ